MKELRVGGKDLGGSEYGLPAISTLSSSWKMLLGWEVPVAGSTYQSGEPLTGLGSKISQLAAQSLCQLIHSDIMTNPPGTLAIGGMPSVPNPSPSLRQTLASCIL